MSRIIPSHWGSQSAFRVEVQNLAQSVFDELDPEPAVADLGEGGQRADGGLGPTVEDRVPAAHVREHEVALAVRGGQVEGVVLARGAAVPLVLALGQEAREDAVLGVEDGQVVVGDDLEARRGGGGGQGGELGGVEVVAWGEATQAGAEEEVDGALVGGVEVESSCP